MALSGWTLLAARCALISGVALVAAFAVSRRWRPALVSLLVVVACAPAWLGHAYSPAKGALWSVVVARAARPEAARAAKAGAAGGLFALVLLSALTAVKPFRPSSAHGTAAWSAGDVLTALHAGLVLGRGKDTPPQPGDVAAAPPAERPRVSPLLRYDGPGQVLTVALTRAGKGIGAVVPNLLNHPGRSS